MKKILFKLIMPLFLIISCSGLKKIEKQLQGNWILTSINNLPIDQNAPTVQFEADKKAISGTDGCNQYRSSFEMGYKNEIRIAPLSKTKMMCVGVMDLAKQFSNYMQTANSIKFNDVGNLVLSTSSNHQLSFKKEK